MGVNGGWVSVGGFVYAVYTQPGCSFLLDNYVQVVLTEVSSS